MKLDKKWLGLVAQLNVSSSNGPKGMAPNKPLLLLSIIDLVEAGKVGVNGLVVKDAELVLRFRLYSPICVKRRGNKIDLDLPFRHLASDGIYTPVGKDEREVILNPEFLALLGDPAFRLKVRKILVSSYFPANEQVGLCAALGISTMTPSEVAKIRKDAEEYKAQMKRGRDARFAVQVISGYYFTCALTGYRLNSDSGFNLLEAAHIQAHSKRGPDVPENGLALTPTAHEMFDAGLWTVSDDFKVIVPEKRFKESVSLGGEHFKLGDRHGRKLCFHGQAQLRPEKQYLEWHRAQAGLAR
jgi:putative restriction endonuclease